MTCATVAVNLRVSAKRQENTVKEYHSLSHTMWDCKLSMQGLLGGIGAAVAAAKVMALDEDGITTVIGLPPTRRAGEAYSEHKSIRIITPVICWTLH